MKTEIFKYKAARLAVVFPAVFFFMFQCPLSISAREDADGRSEKAKSREILQQVSRKYTFIREPEVSELIREIGERIAKAYMAPSGRYNFYVLQNPGVNAFTTPSGDIFIYSGQIERLHSEDELAAVLAHEIAHMEADHFSEIANKNALIAIPTIAALILSKGEEAVVASAIAVASAYQLHFSREMEEEADLMAFNAMRKTGFDPRAMAGALEVILEADRLMPMEIPEHLSTHPPLENRKASLESIMGMPLMEVDWEPKPERRWERIRAVMAGVTAEPADILNHWMSLKSEDLTPREHHLNGLTLMKAGYYKEAVTELKKAVEKTGNDPALGADLGAACYLDGDYQSARKHLESAQKALPQYSYPFYYLAELEREEGHPQRASLLYRKAIEARPELPEAFHRYGLFIGDRGQEGEAVFYLGVAALLKGRYREARSLLGEAKEHLGKDIFWRDRIESRLSVLK